jgi:hypothetical protein
MGNNNNNNSSKDSSDDEPLQELPVVLDAMTNLGLMYIEQVEE